MCPGCTNAEGGEGIQDLQNPLVQIDHVPVAEDQVEVLESFREPEALHAISLPERTLPHINNCCMSNFRSCRLVDILEHPPRDVPQFYFASDAIQYENRLDGLRSVLHISEVLN